MKAECVKDKLVEILGIAEKMTGKNVTLPILSCILIEANKSPLLIKSTNLDIGFEYSIPARISGTGKIAVPGNLINNFLSNLTKTDSVTLESVNGNLQISTENNKAIIKGFDINEYPSIPSVSGESVITMDSENFIKALKSTYFASSISSVRPELSSVLFTTEDDNLICVATDSFRLAEKKIKIKNNKEIPAILIPSKNINNILQVLEFSKGEVELHISKNQIGIILKQGHIVSRLVEGNFPDYKQIIPKEHLTEVIVLKKDLIDALKLSTVFSDKFNQINVSVKNKDKTLEISTVNNETGESKQKINISVSGDSVALNFNHKYISDCFQAIDTDSVSLCFSGPNKPVIISGVSDRSFSYLVMPMNK